MLGKREIFSKKTEKAARKKENYKTGGGPCEASQISTENEQILDVMAGSIDPYTNRFDDDAEYNEEATHSSPPQLSSNVTEQSITCTSLRSTINISRSSKKNATSQNSSSELMEMERKEHALRNIGS